jgi:hypothetical protein
MAHPTEQALVSDQAAERLDPSGFDPSRRITQDDRVWCTEFDRSKGFLEGKWDHSVTMRRVIKHRVSVEAETAKRIFAEIEADLEIGTETMCRIYAAIKRAIVAPAQSAKPRDSDGNPKGGDSEAAPSRSDDSAGREASPNSSVENTNAGA